MAIPILDISAGDTIHSMVQKINYNFDQLIAHGGGPRGEQGERGERGYTGPQGEQGEHGERGSMWFTIVNGSGTNPHENPVENDLGVDGNGYVWMYGDGGWYNTGFSISASLVSAFIGKPEDNIITAIDNYQDYALLLGGNRADVSDWSHKPSLAVVVKTEGDDNRSHSDGIEFYDYEHDDNSNDSWVYDGNYYGRITLENADGDIAMKMESSNMIRLETGSGSLRSSFSVIGSRRINYSPFAGLSNESNVHPILMSNINGDITTGKYTNGQYGYSWFERSESSSTYLVSNGYSALGYFEEPVGGIIGGHPNDETPFYIVGKHGLDLDVDKYNQIISSSIIVAALGVGTAFHALGITIGNPSKPSTDCLCTDRFGLTLRGMDNAMTFNVAAQRNTDYINNAMQQNNKTFTIGITGASCTGTLNMNSSYAQNFKLASQYGSGQLITLKASVSGVSDKLHNQITIKGGKGGNPVSVSGGRGYNERGGDVYISAGDSVLNDPEVSSPNALNFKPFLFGDVVIGVNPDNHKKYYETYTGASDATGSNRGVNDHRVNALLDFYDINNFVAHGNNIWLNSDAQARTFRPAEYGTAYPGVETKDGITFNVGGLCTMHHGVPLVLDGDDIYRNQFMSGNMTYLIRRRITSSGTIHTKVVPLRGTSALDVDSRDFVAMVVTNWTKVGNVVQCSTKINNYFYNKYTNRLSGVGYYIMYDGLDTETYCPVADEVYITNIKLPVVINGCYVNYLSGTGTVISERKLPTGESHDGRFVDNAIQVIFDETSTFSPFMQFGNNAHDENGKVLKTNPIGSSSSNPNGYQGTDISSISEYMLCPSDTVTIIPHYLQGYTHNSYNGKACGMLGLHYTTATFNYMYVLNPDFKVARHQPFDGSVTSYSPSLKPLGEINTFTIGTAIYTGGSGNGGGNGDDGDGGGKGDGGTTSGDAWKDVLWGNGTNGSWNKENGINGK